MIPTGVPEILARFSDSASESTKLRRLGRPVSESWRTRWRSAWSAAWRSIASARTFAEAWTKWTSLGREAARLGRVDVENPEGPVLALDHYREAAADAEHPQRGGHRVAALVRPVVDDHVQPGLDRGAGVGVARRRDALLGADDLALEPGPQVQPSAVALDRPDTGAVDAVGLGHQRRGGSHQGLGVAVPQGHLTEPGDGRLLGGGPCQLLLGVLALGHVVEDSVPDGDAVAVLLDDCLVEDPDGLAIARDHPVLGRDRGRPRGPEVLLLEDVPAVLGMEKRRPELRVVHPFPGAVAEDLLDLGADVAPAPVLAHLGGVDDRRQALDKAPVVLSSGRKLIDELGDRLFRPALLR